jgi:DNA-binding IscR family transcriptional regulator
MLHVLLHMARRDAPLTSETIGEMLGANPVVVRRTLAGLRDAGLVRSEKGHGGGWRLVRDLSEVSLYDLHEALGGPALFAIGNAAENPRCLVERAVNAALEASLQEAEALLLARFRSITLAELAADFEGRLRALGMSEKETLHDA